MTSWVTKIDIAATLKRFLIAAGPATTALFAAHASSVPSVERSLGETRVAPSQIESVTSFG
jgi:hypothetical protein